MARQADGNARPLTDKERRERTTLVRTLRDIEHDTLSANEGVTQAVARSQAIAQSHMALAFETLATIARDPEASASARVAAANAILDRAVGKPAQQIEAKLTTIDVNADYLRALESLSEGAMGSVIEHE